MKPPLLFYCQHAIGMGHLVRSLALAEALTKRFQVVFLSGGRLPRGLPVPAEIEIRTLPPLGLDDHGQLVSLTGGAASKAHRRSGARGLSRRMTRFSQRSSSSSCFRSGARSSLRS